MRSHLNTCVGITSTAGPRIQVLKAFISLLISCFYRIPKAKEDWEIAAVAARAALGASDKSWILFRCHGSSIGSFVVFFLPSRDSTVTALQDRLLYKANVFSQYVGVKGVGENPLQLKQVLSLFPRQSFCGGRKNVWCVFLIKNPDLSLVGNCLSVSLSHK